MLIVCGYGNGTKCRSPINPSIAIRHRSPYRFYTDKATRTKVIRVYDVEGRPFDPEFDKSPEEHDLALRYNCSPASLDRWLFDVVVAKIGGFDYSIMFGHELVAVHAWEKQEHLDILDMCMERNRSIFTRRDGWLDCGEPFPEGFDISGFRTEE